MAPRDREPGAAECRREGHLVLDAEADGDGERADRLRGLEPLSGLHADEWVAE